MHYISHLPHTYSLHKLSFDSFQAFKTLSIQLSINFPIGYANGGHRPSTAPNTHPMFIGAKKGIFKPTILLFMIILPDPTLAEKCLAIL